MVKRLGLITYHIVYYDLKDFFNYLTEVVRVIFKTKGFSPSCKVPDDDRNRGDGPSPTLAPPPIRPLIFFQQPSLVSRLIPPYSRPSSVSRCSI